MVLDYLDPTPNYRLQQICHTLKAIHGVDISRQLQDIDRLQETFNNYTVQRDKLIESSSFNSYLHNPEYIKSMLILEALRIQLTEVAPRRRPKQLVKEAQDSTMATKEQQRLEFARKLEQFATHTAPPSKTGKLSTPEKQLQDQKDLFVIALQTIADKLAHRGTLFAKSEETSLTPLEVKIAKLMRHAESAGILDSLDQKRMDMVVNKGVEMYGNELLAARGATTAPYAQTDKTIDETNGVNEEMSLEIRQRNVAKVLKKLNGISGFTKHWKDQPAMPEKIANFIVDKMSNGFSFKDALVMSHRQVTESKKPDVDGDGIPDWADKHPHKAGGKEDRKLSEFQDDDMFGDIGQDVDHKDPVLQHDIQDIGTVKGVNVHQSDANHDDVKHYEYQASMARSELYRNAKYAMSMMHQISPDDEIQPWIAAALTKAAGYLDKIYHYLDYYKTFEPEQLPEDMDGDMELGETSGSVARENLMLICEYSTKLFDMIKPGDHLEGWVAMKLTTASECISSSKHYLEYVNFEQHGMDDHFDEARHAARKEIAEAAIKSARGRRRLREQQDLAQAETLLAAKDLSDQLQQTAEKVAKMGVEDLMPLVDVMRDQFGPEAAQGFNDTVKAALEGLLDNVTTTKEQVDGSIDTLQGGGIPSQPSNELPAGPEVTGADEFGDEESEDDGLGATPPAAGEKSEPLGRSKKDELAEDFGLASIAAPALGTKAWDKLQDMRRKKKLAQQAKSNDQSQKDAETKVTEASKKCMECGTGMYMETRNGKMKCNNCGSVAVSESTMQGFMRGDRVKHKTQKLGVGTVVADPEDNEYPVKFGNDPEVYYTPAEDLVLISEGKKGKIPPQFLANIKKKKAQAGKKWGKVDENMMQPSLTGVSNPYTILGDKQLQQKAQQGDQQARAELAKRKAQAGKPGQATVTQISPQTPSQLNPPQKITKPVVTQIREVAPPGAAAERFIRQNKEAFKKRYGARGEEVLYATAWKKFGSKSESQVQAETQMEAVQAKLQKMNTEMDVYRADFRRLLKEGTVVDPLNTGYGLDGEVTMQKIKVCEARVAKLKNIIAREQNKGIKKLSEQVAAVLEIRNLQSQMNHNPWGVIYQDHQGNKLQKFFETAETRRYWRDLNRSDIKVIRAIGPSDFAAKIDKLKKI